VDIHRESLLTTRQGAEVGHRPVEADQPKQALDEARRLAEHHAEQHLYRKAGPDGRVAVALLAATPAGRRGLPVHLGVKPTLRRLQAIAVRPMDRQGAPTLERFVIGWPVPGLVGRGCRSARASQLSSWIQMMNPSP